MGVFGNQKQVKTQFLLDKLVDFLPVRLKTIEKRSNKSSFKWQKKHQACLDNGGKKAIAPFYKISVFMQNYIQWNWRKEQIGNLK